MNRNKFKILLLEDNPNLLAMYREWIEKKTFPHKLNIGHECEVLTARDADEFKLHIASIKPGEHIDLVIMDQRISRWEKGRDESGEEEWIEIEGGQKGLVQGGQLLVEFAYHPQIKKIVILTAQGVENPEMERIGQGACEFWNKPEMSWELFRSQIEYIFNLPSRFDLVRYRSAFSETITTIIGKIDTILVGKHIALLKVKAQILEAALSDIPVLITGETGTGKELVAELIHLFSDRGEKVSVSKILYSLNCAEFVEDELLRSELFGHTKGAFTGATIEKKGKLRDADGTTLFLDEVGLASPRLQGLLLRAFEEKKACPVGGEKKYSFDVRFIAATDQDIFGGTDRFSVAFLHRLSGIHIHIPPLRDRKSDIKLIVEELIKDVAPKPKITVAAWQLLEEYDWPGNVRQLKYMIKVLVKRCEITDQKLITRHELETLLPVFVDDNVEKSSDSLFYPFMLNGNEYDTVKEFFSAEYVNFQHTRINGGKRTNEAYSNTARVLNCSVSTIKGRLRDHARISEELQENEDDL